MGSTVEAWRALGGSRGHRETVRVRIPRVFLTSHLRHAFRPLVVQSFRLQLMVSQDSMSSPKVKRSRRTAQKSQADASNKHENEFQNTMKTLYPSEGCFSYVIPFRGMLQRHKGTI